MAKGKHKHRDAPRGSGNAGKGKVKAEDRTQARDSLRKQRKKDKSTGVDADDIKFALQLSKMGLRIEEVAGDGNCIFASIADQLWGIPDQHCDVRKDIVGYIEQKREIFEPFIEDDESFDDYIERMRSEAIWGGHQELVAARDVYEVSIFVHQLGAPRLEIHHDTSKREFHLSYHGDFHYNSVRVASDKGGAPPLPIRLNGSERHYHLDVQGGSESVPNGKGAAPGMPIHHGGSPGTEYIGQACLPTPKEGAAGHAVNPKVRRGADCPCGSGKKYKKCCKKIKNKHQAEISEEDKSLCLCEDAFGALII